MATMCQSESVNKWSRQPTVEANLLMTADKHLEYAYEFSLFVLWMKRSLTEEFAMKIKNEREREIV